MLNKEQSYIFGLLITDGNLSLSTRHRGKVTLEVNAIDEDIVIKLANSIPNSNVHYRTRNTNFKSNYKTAIFSNHRKEFRDFLITAGFPTVNKTVFAEPPIVTYDEAAFWRGVIDGDGSIGFTKVDEPFISLVTKSEELKNAYLNFLEKQFNIHKNIKRNKRDNVYNIVIKNEAAVEMAKSLYLTDNTELYIDRKYNSAKLLQSWVRTKKKRFIN